MLRLTGDMAVRRGDPESGGEAVARARAYLKRGMNVMIFPEGTRSRDARLLPFKKGAFRLAIERRRAGAAGGDLGHGRRASRRAGPRWGPATRWPASSPPVPTAGLTQADAGALRDRVRAAFVAALPPGLVAPAPAEPRRTA